MRHRWNVFLIQTRRYESRHISFKQMSIHFIMMATTHRACISTAVIHPYDVLLISLFFSLFFFDFENDQPTRRRRHNKANCSERNSTNKRSVTGVAKSKIEHRNEISRWAYFASLVAACANCAFVIKYFLFPIPINNAVHFVKNWKSFLPTEKQPPISVQTS